MAPGGELESAAYHVNAFDQSVGWSNTVYDSTQGVSTTPHAVLWNGEAITDLNSQIDPSSGWILQQANANNDRGQIIGIGTLNGGFHGYLLTPPMLPTITGFTPASGAVGTTVTIIGTNLTGTTVVGFQGKHATSFTVNGAGTQITTTVPVGAVTGPIAVLTPGGEAKSATNFTVVLLPTITGFTPASGPVGTSVTITGTNLTGTSVVGFQGQHATSFTVNGSGTQITTTVPVGADTGQIAVLTSGGEAKSSASFTVIKPIITSFSPAFGPAGTTVTITGTNLTGTTIVGFQDKHATSFTVNSTGTQITTTVPVGAVTGPVAVLTNGVEAKSSTNFTVN